MEEKRYQHKPIEGKNPMDKNGLGTPIPSRNQNIGNPPDLKTVAGAIVTDNQDTMTAGKRGPASLQDTWFLEKMAHFDREVIPERRMHAKGSGAFGTFTVTHDITKYTKASIFSKIGKQTEILARFSTVAGERGAADAERDIRGFALKFYTEEGNWDLVGNNTPVFFFRDPLKFIDLNHAIKRDPRTNMRSPNTNWDFWSSLPESLLQVTIIMGDRGIPSSYRHMHGFGSHAFSFINSENERVWVKFHFRSQQGILNLTDQEAKIVVGMDRESHQRDLYQAIEEKIYPKWKMYVQIMTEEEADAMDNYFAEIEQAAFNPASVVPGISFSPDRMLQGRLFSYGDAQRYRLGVNHHQIPVNTSKAVEKPHSFHRDGKMRVDGNLGSELHYEPNSYGNWIDHPEDNLPIEKGGDVYRYDFRKDDSDYYTQPGLLFRAMTDDQKQVLFYNTARNMGDSTLQIKHRHIYNCYQADPAYGKGVAEAMNISIEDVDLNLPTSPVDPGREIDTNVEPYIRPEHDPWLL